jgi:hypothetical protein
VLGAVAGFVIAFVLAVVAVALFVRPDRWRRFASYSWFGALFGARPDRPASRSYIYWSATVFALGAIGVGWMTIARIAAGAG